MTTIQPAGPGAELPKRSDVMDAPRTVTAIVLIIGNEILSGRVEDANLSFLAKSLGALGIRVVEARTLPDTPETIIGALNEVRQGFDYVFTTGGIGPTHDDITAQAVADAFGVPLILHPEAKRLLESHYQPGELNEARLRMAHVPEGAELVANPISRAPGFQLGNVFVLAGVPNVMQAMFEQLKHRLVGGDRMLSRSVSCALGESALARGLAEIQDSYPQVEIGSYPYFRRADFGVTLVLRGTEPGSLDRATEEVAALIRRAGGEPKEGARED